MRENIVYSQTIPEPPRNKNSLEWVLFDFKQAYCVYYASAEVLMLRSVGVPARMAVGFAQGERDENTYVVRRLNSHAWPEVFFPGIGWVEFEPTAGQAPLDRPLPPQDPLDASGLNLPNNLLPEEEGQFASRERDEEGVDSSAQQALMGIQPIYYLLPLLMIVTGLMILIGRRYRYDLPARIPSFLRSAIERTGIDVPAWVIRWETWVRLSPIERAFESVNFALRNLDQAVPVHSTPMERAAKLTRILPAKAGEIKVLLDEHQTSLYTSRIADVTQVRRAAFDLRKQVIVERIRYLFMGKPTR